MKKFVALPFVVAMGLAVTACNKQPPVDNAADSNVVTDETLTDNDTTAGDFAPDNTIGLDNASSADANATDGNSL